MEFGAMLGVSDPGARWHKGDRSGPQADHGRHVLLSTPFYGAAFEDETTHAEELVSITVMNALGTATIGLCFLSYSWRC